MKILIVEDDPSSFTFIKKIIKLHHHNCEVKLAENGLEALKRLEEEEYDGIISDISMPVMSGLEMFEALVDNPDTKNIPVMMSSASNNRMDVEEALKLGATDYLLKPLMANEATSRINRFIELIKNKKEEAINKNNNDEQKQVLIISSTLDDWKKTIEDYENEYKFILFSSASDGIEYYMNSYPAYVVLDKNIKIISDKFVAKKIRRTIQEKALRNIIIKSTIIGLNQNNDPDDFDLIIDSPTKLGESLKEFEVSEIQESK